MNRKQTLEWLKIKRYKRFVHAELNRLGIDKPYSLDRFKIVPIGFY